MLVPKLNDLVLKYLPLIKLNLFGLGKCSGISFIDSTALKVCHYKREKQNKVFQGIAEKSLRRFRVM